MMIDKFDSITWNQVYVPWYYFVVNCTDAVKENKNGEKKM